MSIDDEIIKEVFKLTERLMHEAANRGYKDIKVSPIVAIHMAIDLQRNDLIHKQNGILQIGNRGTQKNFTQIIDRLLRLERTWENKRGSRNADSVTLWECCQCKELFYIPNTQLLQVVHCPYCPCTTCSPKR